MAEQDIGLITVGMPAKITFRALLDRPYEGHVAFVLHELDARTRTGKVRIEVKNPEHRIRHEMYAEVEMDAATGVALRLAIPTSAVIDSGNRQVVIVERGEGPLRDETRQARPQRRRSRRDSRGPQGRRKVVVTVNFLIDAESNLRAALRGFTADAPNPAPAPETKQ